jgi:hypothetical protein
LVVSCGWKQENKVAFIGQVSFLVGKAEIFTSRTKTWNDLKIFFPVEFWDSVKTCEELQLEISFDGENILRQKNKAKENKQEREERKNEKIQQYFFIVTGTYHFLNFLWKQ